MKNAWRMEQTSLGLRTIRVSTSHLQLVCVVVIKDLIGCVITGTSGVFPGRVCLTLCRFQQALVANESRRAAVCDLQPTS
jgi:hypothetical protein